MRRHVAVGVPSQAVDPGPPQPGNPTGAAGGEGVHVGADANPGDDHEARARPDSSASASTRSIGRAILNAAGSPGTVCTGTPSFSTMPAPSVCWSAALACPAATTARPNPCGVCTARSTDRSTVPTTVPEAATSLTVSTTGSTGITASYPPRTAAATDSTSEVGASARAASWTSTISNPSGTADSAAATEACRVAPPGTTIASSNRLAT